MSNLLALEQFRRELSYNPFHFWGWENALVPVNSQCNTVVKQYAWQQVQTLGRAEIRLAIAQAEARLCDYLGFSIAPHFVTDDVKNYPMFYDPRITQVSPVDATGRWKPVTLKEGYIQAVGVESLTLLETAPLVNNSAPPFFPFTDATPATPYLIYLDTDNDGLADTFEIGIDSSVTDASRIALYFAPADRLTSELDEWRILPLQVVIDSGVATIRGRSWLLARPVLYEGVATTDLDPSTVANYAQSLAVYQRVCSSTGQTLATAQGEFIWETLPYCAWWGFANAGDNATDPAAQAYAIARVGLRDPRNGIVIPGEAIYNADTGEWAATMPPWGGLLRPPDRVQVRYYAGYPLDAQNQIPVRLQTVVARLAMATMTERIAACDEANRTLYFWQKDRSQISDRTDEYRISNRDLDAPLGTKAGQIYAWHETRQMRQLRGVTTN